jgi:UDPglucose 6-dehydrogenase
LKAFRAVARNRGSDFGLLSEVIRINDEQCLRFLRKVRNALWTLKGKRIAVLGLAFKGGTDDIRESPAISLVRLLLREGCEVAAYDPAAMERAREVLDGRLEYAENAYEAAEDADALLVLTDWEEFATLDLGRLRAQLRYPIVVDGRNLFDPDQMAQAGFIYYSVGRPEVYPARVAGQERMKKAS